MWTLRQAVSASLSDAAREKAPVYIPETTLGKASSYRDTGTEMVEAAITLPAWKHTRYWKAMRQSTVRLGLPGDRYAA